MSEAWQSCLSTPTITGELASPERLKRATRESTARESSEANSPQTREPVKVSDNDDTLNRLANCVILEKFPD